MMRCDELIASIADFGCCHRLIETGASLTYTLTDNVQRYKADCQINELVCGSD